MIRFFVRFLKGKRYSSSTVSTYFTFVADFIDFVAAYKPTENITNHDIRKFIEEIIVPKGYTSSSHRQVISALKQFAEFAPSLDIEVAKIHMPPRDKKLPSVLSKKQLLHY